MKKKTSKNKLKYGKSNFTLQYSTFHVWVYVHPLWCCVHLCATVHAGMDGVAERQYGQLFSSPFSSQKPQQLARAPSQALISTRQSFRHPTSPFPLPLLPLLLHTHSHTCTRTLTYTNRTSALTFTTLVSHHSMKKSHWTHTGVHEEIKMSHFERSSTITSFYLESY